MALLEHAVRHKEPRLLHRRRSGGNVPRIGRREPGQDRRLRLHRAALRALSAVPHRLPARRSFEALPSLFQQTTHAVHSKNPIFVKSSLNCASFSASMHRLPLSTLSLPHPNVRLGPASTPWKPQIALNSVIESTPSPYLFPA